MKRIALLLQIFSAGIFGIVLAGGIIMFGYDSIPLPLAFWVCCSLIPHSVLITHRLLTATILAASLFGLLWMAYQFLSFGEASAVMVGIAFSLLLGLLPASIVLSFMAARIAQSSTVARQHAA